MRCYERIDRNFFPKNESASIACLHGETIPAQEMAEERMSQGNSFSKFSMASVFTAGVVLCSAAFAQTKPAGCRTHRSKPVF